MARRRYWVGDKGPFLQVNSNVPPFRFESLEDAEARESGRGGTGVSVIRGTTGREETVVTSSRVGANRGLTGRDNVSGDDYAAYLGAHTFAFKQATI